jgi:phospholipid-binding lipoprotein MlaA
MPNAALIALTAPLVLGQAPEAALEALPPLQADAYTAPAGYSAGDTGILLVSWSLSSRVQAQMQPGEEAANPEGPPEDQAPEDQASQDQADGNVIVVEGEYGPPEGDPIARINEESYRITQQLDDTFVEPVAYAYRDGIPGPLRDGLGNVVNNLREPNNALNFLLQGKIGKTLETLGRFAINSTFGLGGLIDIAEKPGIGLPFRRNGFGNTMGVYGVGAGPYLYLPLTGATTARDFTGSFLDQLLLPVAVGKPFNRLEFTVPFYLVANLEDRLAVDAEMDRIADTIDPYAARRDSYLYRRAREIAELKGEEPPEPPAILEEVEGTGDFADPPVSDTPPSSGREGRSKGRGDIGKPAMAVIITQPR